MILVIFFNRKANLKISFIKYFITKQCKRLPSSCLMRWCLTLSTLSFGFPFKHSKFEGIDLFWLDYPSAVYTFRPSPQTGFGVPLQILPTSEKLLLAGKKILLIFKIS